MICCDDPEGVEVQPPSGLGDKLVPPRFRGLRPRLSKFDASSVAGDGGTYQRTISAVDAADSGATCPGDLAEGASRDFPNSKSAMPTKTAAAKVSIERFQRAPVMAGPGQTPAAPQPTPNRMAPAMRRASMG